MLADAPTFPLRVVFARFTPLADNLAPRHDFACAQRWDVDIEERSTVRRSSRKPARVVLCLPFDERHPAPADVLTSNTRHAIELWDYIHEEDAWVYVLYPNMRLTATEGAVVSEADVNPMWGVGAHPVALNTDGAPCLPTPVSAETLRRVSIGAPPPVDEAALTKIQNSTVLRDMLHKRRIA